MDTEIYTFDIEKAKGITQDSREVGEGFIFAAIPGFQVDGRDYIDQAVQKGARYILSLPDTKVPEGIELIADENPRLGLAVMAARFYKDQPENIVAVTGTNGKTSVAHFVKQFWDMQNIPSYVFGTIGGNLTTPDPVSLHKKLAELKAKGINHVVMEASSQGLDQYRLDGVKLKAAAFTNLTQDHLDYHASLDEYFSAKMRLFTDLLPRDAVAVLNADIHEYEILKDLRPVISYGHKGKDYKITDVDAEKHRVGIGVGTTSYELHFNLSGDFQLMNALCALALVRVIDPAYPIENLEKLQSVRGRLELVEGHPSGAKIYVDYAHTPDALESVLKALRADTKGRLICVFGCGGDRDTDKRPKMGHVASEYADYVIVTDDNPRSEDPSDIRRQIVKGISKDNYEILPGRDDAIDRGVFMLEEGDVLLVAGKGHEQGQIFKSKTIPFDDVTQVQKAIQNIGERKND